MLGACLAGSPVCPSREAAQSNDAGSPNAGRSKPTAVLDFSCE